MLKCLCYYAVFMVAFALSGGGAAATLIVPLAAALGGCLLEQSHPQIAKSTRRLTRRLSRCASVLVHHGKEKHPTLHSDYLPQ